ncbi:MAG: hypothetical protein AB1918_14505 [Pseudomonadota bacterium]
MIDWGAVKDWAGLIALAVSLIGWPALMYRLSAVFASRKAHAELKAHVDGWIERHGDAHDDLEGKLAEGEAKFREIDVTLKHLPNRKDHDDLVRSISDLRASVQGIVGKMDAMATSLAGLQSSVAMIVDHELAEGRQAKKGGHP